MLETFHLCALQATSQSINDAASPNPELQAFVCGGERLEPKKPFARSMSMGDLGPRRNKCQSPASKKRDRRDRCVDDGTLPSPTRLPTCNLYG